MTARRTFVQLRSTRRVRRGPVTVAWVRSGTSPQVAYAVTRKVGGAVVRNRVRRRLRSATSELAPHLSPGAYLIGAGGPEAAAVSYQTLTTSLRRALDAAGDTGPERPLRAGLQG